MSSPSSSNLFSPIQIGNMTLRHRVVHAPLTRNKAIPLTNVPIVNLVKTYYSQRASTPGTLLIAEGTLVSLQGGGRRNMPGMWSEEQISAWKEVVDAVHAKESFLFMQIRAMGRSADPAVLEMSGLSVVGPSPIPIKGKTVPRELTILEIHDHVRWHAEAATNAIDGAGCDGVELHFAYGYLGDQFIQDVSNQRTDQYGGSIEKRNRFPLEVVDAVVKKVGEERTAVRLSPWCPFQDMGMVDPVPQISSLIQALKDGYPDLAYLHLVEPGIDGAGDPINFGSLGSNQIFRDIWAPKPFIAAGGFTRDSAIERADSEGDLIAFGRFYISNPDLPARLKYCIPLTPPDRQTFYVPGMQKGTEVGYIDYPFADELKSIGKI